MKLIDNKITARRTKCGFGLKSGTGYIHTIWNRKNNSNLCPLL